MLAAKRAIADEIGQPLARLLEEERGFIDALVRRTLNKSEVLACTRAHFNKGGP